MKKYNFNAGPSILPKEVMEATAAACLEFEGSGLSLMETSHRAKNFQPVVDEAVALFKELLNIPEGYSVIFLGGGASLQFCMVPYNFLEKKAAYLNTGVWATKAEKEAKLFGEVVEVASSKDKNFTYTTESEKAIEKLKKVAKEEGYLDKIQPQIEQLEKNFAAEKENDLISNRKDIEELMRSEIVGRYYFQKGRIVASLKDDPDLKRAFEILLNTNGKDEYHSILSGE